ncbi:hypothetical protein [Solibacillus ferritrahens]|uniref:hypothetical protein n=1 Tax=Solibacillus ferritrahens TaxID=3098620 RepID=UPI00300B558A
MCDTLKRFGVSMEPTLLKQLDDFVLQKGFQNRSHAIRSIVRETLINQLDEKDVVYASIQLSKEALESRFSEIIKRCEYWGSIKAFTTVFTDYQTISMHFILEMETERIGVMENDPLLYPITIHSKGSDKCEINE